MGFLLNLMTTDPNFAQIVECTISVASTQTKGPADARHNKAGLTRLELAAFCVTGRRSNQTELQPRKYLLFKRAFPILYFSEEISVPVELAGSETFFDRPATKIAAGRTAQ